MDYKRIYDSIIERAKERVPEGYVERHHIVPSCMGGSDDKHNLVALTPEEHFLCHVLLVKIYPEHTGLIYAVNMMCTGHAGKRKRRKIYGWLKRRYSKQRKIDAKGSGNSQHKTKWINKIGTTENKKISVKEQVPDGWQNGRSLSIIKNRTCLICNANFFGTTQTCSKTCSKKNTSNNRRRLLEEGNVVYTHAKKVEVDGVVYNTTKDSANAHNISRETARLRCLSDKYKNWNFVV